MEEKMKQRPCKPVSASRTEQTHIVVPQYANGANYLFGGQLMQWVDEVAGIVGHRHCAGEVRTVAIDHMDFLSPTRINETVTVKGRITYAGRTSMEIFVESYAETLDNPTQPRLINRAYLTLVAVDPQGHPTPVPGLICETEAERADQQAGERRAMLRKGQSM